MMAFWIHSAAGANGVRVRLAGLTMQKREDAGRERGGAGLGAKRVDLLLASWRKDLVR